MPNEVEILISAVDRASAILGKAGGKTGIVGSFTELKSAIGLAQQALKAIGDVYNAAVGETMAYDLSMRKLAKTLNIGTEETSRLIQAGDDLGAEQGALTTALQFASKNGLAPTIENIANASDELLAMTDVTQRNEAAAKQFGRGWTEVSQVILAGGDRIRELAAAQAEGMIVTEKEAEKAEELRIAIDNLNDIWTAFKNDIGNEIIPELVKLGNQLAHNMAVEDAYAANLYAEEQGYITHAEKVRLDALAQRDLEGAVKELNDDLVRNYEYLQAVKKATDEQNEAERELNRATQEGIRGQEYQAAGLPPIISGVKKLTENFIPLQEQIQQTINKQTDYTGSAYSVAQAEEAAAQKAKDLQSAQENLASAQGDLQTAQQKLNDELGNMAQNSAEKAHASAKKTLEAYKIQDIAFGTHTAITVEKAGEVDKATLDFLNSPQKEADKAAYLKRLDDIKAKYAETDLSIEASEAKVKELQGVIDSLTGKEVYIDVITRHREGSVTTPPNTPGAPGRQAGGPVSAGQSYMVGENGPELFTPSVGGSITNNYNLTIHSNARTENLVSDFHIIKSLSHPGD